MDKNRFAAILAVFLLFVMPVSGLTQTAEDMKKEMNAINSEIASLDRMIQDNNRLIRMLRGHESRLRAAADDPKIHRLPLLIEGKVVYTTVGDTELEDFSQSLALEDLLIRHKVTKGSFRSDDPAEWKRILMEESKEAREHLQLVELPAIEKRIDEQDRETRKFEARRNKLYERYKMLQQKLGGG
ncbi:MAG TPA: hypothetical protein VMB77_02475 [Syntrophales bacterium]|nr:hypothetical protein [Syntrophales bacterium]